MTQPDSIPQPAAQQTTTATTVSAVPAAASHKLYDVQPLQDNGANYQTWKYRVLKILTLRKLDGIVNGTDKNPGTLDPRHAAWQARNEEALAQITLLLKDDPLNGVLHDTEASVVWSKLKARYEGTGQQSIAQLIAELFRSTLSDDSQLEPQLNAMLQKSYILRSLGLTLEDSLVAVAMVISLPPSYDTLRTILMQNSGSSKLSTETVITQVLTEEKLRRGRDTAITALYAKHTSPPQAPAKGKPKAKHESSGKKSGKGEKKCDFCGKKGHIKDECRKLEAAKKELSKDSKDSSKSGDLTAKLVTTGDDEFLQVFVAEALSSRTTMLSRWIVDSGASAPMCSQRDWFINYRILDTPKRVWLGDKRFIHAVGIGQCEIEFDIGGEQSRRAVIQNVYHVPDLNGNLLSVSHMVKTGHRVTFDNNGCIIKNAADNIIGNAYSEGELYVLRGKVIPPQHVYVATVNSSTNEDTDLQAFVARARKDDSRATAHTWHRRFGHLSVESVLKLVRKGMVKGMSIIGSSPTKKDPCKPCHEGKQSRKPVPKQSESEDPTNGFRIHSDVCGPMTTATRSGDRYFTTFIVGKRPHKVFVRLLKTKDEVLKHAKEVVARVEAQTGKRVVAFRSDGGGEYCADEFEEWLKSRGIHHEKTTAYTPQENGVAERMNRTLVEMTRAMLKDADLPDSYWGDAVTHAANILNVSPTRAFEGDVTPEEAYSGNKPSVAHLRTFGCKAFMHVPKEKRHKLDAKSIECTYLGYAENRKAFRLVQRSTGRLFESRDIEFYEEDEPEPTRVRLEVDVENAGTETPAQPITSHSLKPSVKEDDKLPQLVSVSDDESDWSDDEEEEKEVDDVLTPEPESRPPSPPQPRRSTRPRRAPVSDDDPRYSVSSYDRKRQPRRSADSVGDESARLASLTDEPRTYKEAMSRPDADQWKEACAEELRSFLQLGVYEETERPRGRRVVDCKWVFKIKRGPDGAIEKYKARLVARGFTQVEGVDYTETFAPVSKFSSIRALLALAAKLDLEIHQMDVKTAFLHGDLDEEIFMEAAPGFEFSRDKVWKLHKSIYGLKQASREWYKKIRAEFEDLGFMRSDSDHSLFTKQLDDGSTLIIALYVDDMLLLSKDVKAIEEVKRQLKTKFEMKDLGEARWILNMEIIRNRAARTIELSQRQYITDILERYQMANVRPVSTPMAANLKLIKIAEPEIDAKAYQSALGSLMYAMLGSRPDIAYAVGALSQHAATPGKEHWSALMRVFQYLRGTTDKRLVYNGLADSEEILGYIDADWAGDPNSRRSVTGYVFLMAGAAVSWSSKKQPSVALSSTEAEYMAGAAGSKEASWFRHFLKEVGQPQTEGVPLLIDNQSAILLAKNPTFHERTKHIAVRHHFIREKVETGEVKVDYVPTGDQVADVLTKPLAREKHETFTKGMGLL